MTTVIGKKTRPKRPIIIPATAPISAPITAPMTRPNMAVRNNIMPPQLIILAV